MRLTVSAISQSLIVSVEFELYIWPFDAKIQIICSHVCFSSSFMNSSVNLFLTVVDPWKFPDSSVRRNFKNLSSQILSFIPSLVIMIQLAPLYKLWSPDEYSQSLWHLTAMAQLVLMQLIYDLMNLQGPNLLLTSILSSKRSQMQQT